MSRRSARLLCVLPLIATVVSCSDKTPAQPSTTTTPTVPSAPSIVISAPTPVAPANGVTTTGWPTFTVTNSVRTGPAGALVYRFDVSTSDTFSPIIVTATVSETPNQTSFTPSSSLAAPSQTALFWRAIAIDPFNVVSSPTTSAQRFTYGAPLAVAAKIAAQMGTVLWPGTQPTGTNGQATLGDNWDIQTLYHAPTNTYFQSPSLDQLRFFDLFDRGFDPQSAIDWMNSHGYPVVTMWYPPPEKAVLGFAYVYLAARNKIVEHGTWDLVLKAE